MNPGSLLVEVRRLGGGLRSLSTVLFLLVLFLVLVDLRDRAINLIRFYLFQV